MKDSVSSQKGVTLEEMSHPTAKEAQEQAIPKTLEKYEQLCELSRAYPLAKTSASVRIKNNYQSTCLLLCVVFHMWLYLLRFLTCFLCCLFQSVSQGCREFLKLANKVQSTNFNAMCEFIFTIQIP